MTLVWAPSPASALDDALITLALAVTGTALGACRSLLMEEWHHIYFANRDLAQLEGSHT